MVTRLGGHVTEVSVLGGGDPARQAHLVARVPAERFDEALAGLESVGGVEEVQVTAQDVGEEYVDVAAQLRNRQRLEQRLLELLETRTGRLEDVLAVERELARVREEIERQEGRLRYLRNRVSLSTLYITLREPAPLLSTSGGQNVFAHAVRSAWLNFLDVIVFLISALGVVIPLAVVAWLLWKPARWWRRRRRAPDA